jgi:hypothetical protein
MNYDVGCRAANFVVGVSAPGGFSMSLPTSTVTVKPSSSRYVYASVTSPATAADGDYPLAFTVRRASDSVADTLTSYYKVYSSDTAAPTLYWVNPGDGSTISGASTTFTATLRGRPRGQEDRALRRRLLPLDDGVRQRGVQLPAAYDGERRWAATAHGDLQVLRLVRKHRRSGGELHRGLNEKSPRVDRGPFSLNARVAYGRNPSRKFLE